MSDRFQRRLSGEQYRKRIYRRGAMQSQHRVGFGFLQCDQRSIAHTVEPGFSLNNEAIAPWKFWLLRYQTLRRRSVPNTLFSLFG